MAMGDVEIKGREWDADSFTMLGLGIAAKHAGEFKGKEAEYGYLYYNSERQATGYDDAADGIFHIVYQEYDNNDDLIGQ